MKKKEPLGFFAARLPDPTVDADIFILGSETNIFKMSWFLLPTPGFKYDFSEFDFEELREIVKK